MPTAVPVTLSELETLIIALVALFAGKAARAGLPWLKRIDIPDAVIGGLATALLALIARLTYDVQFTFGHHLRDLLLLIFFSTVGLSAKLRTLVTGGKPLVILCTVTVVLIVLQNLVGAAVALAWGAHPFYGLLAGGLSFVGGPGTAMAWAKEAEAAGLEAAAPVGIGAATIAVIAGALLAGPIAGFLIKRKGLKPSVEGATGILAVPAPDASPMSKDFALSSVLAALLVIAISVFLGEQINGWAQGNGVMLPGFLCALLAGILIANGADACRLPLDLKPIAIGGDVALNIFLAMSLMSVPLSALFTVILPLMINVIAQILVIVIIAYYVLFPLLGRDYDAAVATSGFLGFGLASMPVAMVTMNEVTKRYGPSPKAILLVTLAAAFFVDLANAMVAKLFLALPLFRMG
ncbi:sodium/glutamate symporter [Hypericibacter sp.]|uniref:sodium/glutamate symporter n=1 Tax=Hypericibacter sp. TaxID=2705401 RepID=UPI003D6D91C4